MAMVFLTRYDVDATNIQEVDLDLSSVPDIYDDLYILASMRSSPGSNNGGVDLYMTFNNSTTGYGSQRLNGNSSGGDATGGSQVSTSIQLGQSMTTNVANQFGSYSIYIQDYKRNGNKNVLVDAVYENDQTTALQYIISGVWLDANPITSVQFDSEGINLIERYSSFTIYGIAKGSDGTTTVS